MRITIEGNRVKVYDEKGELVQERDATLEDFIRYLTENIELELEIPGIGKAKARLKEVKV